ncbi:MAG: hypothetical protein EXR07_06255 [Acetobacteraceae bacterium]|nr:hypothetical protein [Acetobacteraceae bacterium]
MLQMLNLPEWLPWWVPLILLLPTSLWALSFLFMPFSVFGVKSRLDVIEARLDEIQNEIRHVVLRLPPGGVPGPDYDDVFPPRMTEQRMPERLVSRPPIPPAPHELYNAHEPDHRADPRGDPRGDQRMDQHGGPPPLEDRPPPSPNARPPRRNEPLTRPARAEPRLDWRR